MGIIQANAEISSNSLAPSRFGFTPKRTLIELFPSGHGWTKTSPAGSAMSDDTTIFRAGTQSLHFTTTTSLPCFADKIIPADLSDQTIVMDVYIPDASVITSIDLLVSPTTSFTNYFAGQVLGYELRDGWNTVNFIPQLFSALGATPPTLDHLSSIQKWRIKLIGNSGEIANCYFDRIQLQTNVFSKGKVVVRMDDGHNTVFSLAKPILDKYNLRATIYAITNQVGVGSNRMTLEQLKTLDALGWDICSHTKDHLYFLTDALTPDQIDDQLKGSKQWLLDNGFFRGADHLATPGGEFNLAIIEQIKMYYSSHVTVLDGFENYPFSDPVRIKVQNVLNTTTVDEVETWIDSAASAKCLLMLVFHYLDEQAEADTQVTPENFNLMMAYLSSQVTAGNVDQVTISDLAGYAAAIM